MTEPTGQPVTDSGVRLSAAIDQLLLAETRELDRDQSDVRRQLADEQTSYLADMTYLAERIRDGADRADEQTIERARTAIDEVVDRHRSRVTALTTTTARLPSLLDQLHDAVTSANGVGNGSRGPHRSPLNSTAVEVLTDIRRTVVDPDADEPQQLHVALAAWRPADVDAAAEKAERWVIDARAIVSPARWTEAARPCPNCGTRHVFVTEDGQRIRKAAIQVNLTEGYAACIAHSCSAWWDRTRFTLLAAALEHEDVPT